jgi:chromosome segregation ATPase
MASDKQPVNPSLTLINDEILSTQVRLMELYVKQAQATAANEAARSQERFQAELSALQAELKQKNLALESQKAISDQADRNLKADPRARLLGSPRLLEARETDFGTTTAQGLRQRIAQLESTVQKAQLTTEFESARARERWQAELEALKTELERKESLPEIVPASVNEVAGTLGAEIQDLRSQLAAKLELLEHRSAELQNARTQITLLQQRIQQLELTGVQTEEAASEGTRIRKTLQAELIRLRAAFEQKDLALQQNHTAATELERRLNVQLRGLQNQLAEKQELLETRSQKMGELTTKVNELQEQIAHLELANKQIVEQAQSAARTLQDGLRARLQELEASASEKADLLQNRTAELENTQAEIALLRERIQQLELNGAETKAAAIEATRIRETLQAELVVLRTAVKQKGSSLQQTHAASRELEERLNAQLHDLQRQLAKKEELLETRSQEIDELTARTHDLQEQILCLELANKQTVKETQAAGRAVQDGLRARLQELEATVLEKAHLLQNRTAELESAQAETAQLRERITQLELNGAQTEAARNEGEKTREALQHRLAEVQRALEDKDASIAQRETQFKESSERLHTQLNDLNNQLAEKQQLLAAKDGDLGRAAGEIAGLEERITQLESLHAKVQAATATEVDRVEREFKAERLALQTSLREKEQALREHEAAVAELKTNLNDQIQDLSNRLIESQQLLEQRDHEFQNVGSQTALLRERITQLEFNAYQADQSAAELQEKLATLEGQLKQKEQQLVHSDTLARESEEQLQIRLDNLQVQIAEKQLLLETRNLETSSLQDQLRTASEQQAQLESTSQQAIAEAAKKAEIAQQRFDAEIAARNDELRSMKQAVADYQAQASDLQQAFDVQLRGLQSQLAEKQELLETRSQEIDKLTASTHDLQEQIVCLELANKQTVTEAQAAGRAFQDGLNARLQELEAIVSEKADLLQSRTAELESAQAETVLLRERITQVELREATTKAAQNEAERIREVLQNQLGNVQRALEEKDASLAQREAEFKESSDRLNAQLNDLKNQLAEKRHALETQKHELLSARSEITTLGDRIHELQHAKTTGERNASLEIERLREQYQMELAGLRAELAQRQLALEEEQTNAHLLGEKLKDDLHRLEAQLTEKQGLLHRGDLELEEHRSEIIALREELARSEFARRQTETLATTQAEEIRERFKAEVEALDAQLREKDNALKSLVDRGRELELRIDDLRQQLAGKESLLESRDTEVTGLRTQAHDLLAQITHMEQAHEQALEQQQVAAGQLEQNHRVQVHELQNQLTEKLTLLETRNKEVQALESKVTELVDRIDRSEVALDQAGATAASEIEQLRRESQEQLTARQAEIERKVEGLQDREAALYAAEQNFKIEMDALRTEVAEKRFLLENRNEQLVRVKMEVDVLQDRIGYLESAAKQGELESLHEDKRAQEQSRPELARLWQKLSQKEKMLEQRQTAVNDLDQGFQAEINSLRSELAEKQALLENPSTGFLIGEPTLTESQKEKLSRLEQLVETIKADNEQTLSPHNRKWRFSLSRKRRWKF